MTEAIQEYRNSELKNKKICRFCLTQNDLLSNIYSRENRLKCSAPLPLQVMACVSIEVFTNDGMPCNICDYCRIMMDYCYRFKQMCKKADTTLRQYPLTGSWPDALEYPKISEELIRKQFPNFSKDKKPQIIVKSPIASSTEAVIVAPIHNQLTNMKIEPKISSEPGRPPKLLNKNSVKILNKSAQVDKEPILSKPKLKRDDAGNMELVTEIIERVEELDPITSAAPVETNVFPCPHCERSFPLRQLLDMHMRNHSRERGFQCNLCEKRFFSKYDLGKHTLIHTGEKPYECVVCKKAFTRSTLLYRHEKTHTDQPKYLCVYCEKSFLSTEELEKHTLRHKKSRPFACKICGKCFAFKQGLERHETVHAKDQPYPCHYCDQSFSTPSKLSRHLTAHAGDRPFPCKLCPKSYLLSHHLSRHLRSHTQGSGSYKCYDCEKTFTSRDDLIYHSAVHATQTLVCPLCKEHFSDLDLVTEHIKQHAEGEQYACEFCDLIFMTSDKLQAHSDVAHSDDLAAYAEHTRNNLPNIKKEITKYTYEDSSQDVPIDANALIEEFIIEEFPHDIVIENVIEDKLNTGDNKPKAEIVSGKQTKNALNLNRRSRSSGSNVEHTAADEEYESMEVEALEHEYEENDLDIQQVEENYEEEYQPIAKIRKTSNESVKEKPQIKAVVAKEIQKQKPTKQSVDEKPEARTPKLKQLFLPQLPKGVTLIKSEKISPAEKKPDLGIRILNQQIKPAPQEVKVVETKRHSISLRNKTPVHVQKRVSTEIEKFTKSTATATTNLTSLKSAPLKQEVVIAKRSSGGSRTSSSPIIPQQQQAELQKQRSSQQQIQQNQQSQKQHQQQKQQQQQQQQQKQQQQQQLTHRLGERKPKSQKIILTKAEVDAMVKEGKIERKDDGTMVLKSDKVSSKPLVKKN